MSKRQYHTLTIQNFMSFGNDVTSIDLSGHSLTAIMGVNHDTDNSGSRNGVGKSVVIDAFDYVTNGKLSRGISNNRIRNKMAVRGQPTRVTLSMTIGDHEYMIIRGESPSVLKLFKKPVTDERDILHTEAKKSVFDVSQSKNETTAEIQNLLDIDSELSRFLMINTAKDVSLAKLPEAKRKALGERVMGITILSQKADALKSVRNDTTSQINIAQAELDTNRLANKRVEDDIARVEDSISAWESSHASEITRLNEVISAASEIDIEAETRLITELEAAQKDLNEARAAKDEAQLKVTKLTSAIRNNENSQQRLIDEATRIEKEINAIDAGTCPHCEQHWVPDQSVRDKAMSRINEIAQNLDELTDAIKPSTDELPLAETEVDTSSKAFAEISSLVQERQKVPTTCRTLAEAARLETEIKNAQDLLEQKSAETNPHVDILDNLKTNTLVEIDETPVNELNVELDHLKALISLLSDQSSALRRNIIARWLPAINTRIAHYLNIMELPFDVQLSDTLALNIENSLGDYDWGSLSNGQQRRVDIAINLAIQDVYSATNGNVGILFIDELLDNGLCTVGAEQALVAIQSSTKGDARKVFLITHRADIAEKTDETITVEMKNKTSYIEEEVMLGFEDQGEEFD